MDLDTERARLAFLIKENLEMQLLASQECWQVFCTTLIIYWYPDIGLENLEILMELICGS